MSRQEVGVEVGLDDEFDRHSEFFASAMYSDTSRCGSHHDGARGLVADPFYNRERAVQEIGQIRDSSH